MITLAPAVILVGELNPYGSDPYYALYNNPPGSAGERMQRMVMGIHSPRYRALPRHNLCTGRWSMVAARAEAKRLMEARPVPVVHPPEYRPDVFVLLGRKVATAFGMADVEPFTVLGIYGDPKLVRTVVLPHPSGLCRVWQEPGAVARARELLRTACPDLGIGEADVTRG